MGTTAEFLIPGKEIPWEWSEVVCSCADPDYTHWQDVQKGRPDICLRCKKHPRWKLLTCRICDNLYFWSFTHHARVPGGGKCWNCLVEVAGVTNEDIPPLYTESPRRARSFEEIDLGSISFDF